MKDMEAELKKRIQAMYLLRIRDVKRKLWME